MHILAGVTTQFIRMIYANTYKKPSVIFALMGITEGFFVISIKNFKMLNADNGVIGIGLIVA